MIFKITHYFPKKSFAHRCVELLFITQKRGEENSFFLGFETNVHLMPEIIMNKKTTGELIELNKPVEADTTQKLWLAPNGEIFLSSWKESQEKDPNKIRVLL